MSGAAVRFSFKSFARLADRSAALWTAALLVAALYAPIPAKAASSPGPDVRDGAGRKGAPDDPRDYDIPEQPLALALKTFAEQAGISLIYEAMPPPHLTVSLRGRLNVSAGLAQILRGSGLKAELFGANIYLLSLDRRPDAPAASGLDRPSALLTRLRAGLSRARARKAAEEIVVTALKRSTSLADTPIGLSALSDTQLRHMGVDGLADRHVILPGLVVTHGNAGGRRLALRGVLGVGEPQVGLYYDETPVVGAPGTASDAGNFAPDFSFFDVERVEILRGPQGTLYGAGSMGGTVRIIMNKPDPQKFAAQVEGGLETVAHGGFGHRLNGLVNMPVVADKLAVRIALQRREHGGYVDKPGLGLRNTDDKTSTSGRFSARLEPDDDKRLTFSVNWQRDAVGDDGRWSRGAGPHDSRLPVRLPYRDSNRIVNLTYEQSLSAAAVTFSTSYYDRDMSAMVDTSKFIRGLDTNANCARLNGGLPCDLAARQAFSTYVQSFAPSVLLYEPQDVRNWINELRIGSRSDSPLQWTFGVFTEDRRAHIVSAQYKTDAATGLPDGSAAITSRAIRDRLTQKALFGELGYDLTDALTLTFGTRYFDYSKTIVGETTKGFDLLGAVESLPTRVQSSQHGWIFKVHGGYRLNDDVLIYAQAAQGFRPGGVNQIISLPVALAPYEADTLWNYELGTRSSWFDNRLVANLAAYWIDWQNMQVVASSPNFAFNFIGNAGAARIRGLELELIARPLKGLSLSGALNYVSARLRRDQIEAAVQTPGRRGDPVPNVPKWTALLSAEYKTALGQTLGLGIGHSWVGLLRADVSYVGHSHSTFSAADPYFETQGDFALVNLRAGVESGVWDGYVYLNNLFDSAGAFTASSSKFQDQVVTSAPPRTIGIQLVRSW